MSYNNVFSWAGAFLVELKIGDNCKWTVDLTPNIEAVGSPHLAAGGAPPLASAPPLEPGGAAPPGSIALLDDGPPASTVAGSDKRDAKAEKPVESQAKRARLSADSPADGVDGSHQPVTAAGEGAPPFGSSSPRWLLQKALRLYQGGPLDDPASLQYDVAFVTKHAQTAHSVTWKVPQKHAEGALVFIKQHLKANKEEFLKEVDFLDQLRHPSIINLIDVAFIRKCNSMVLEYGGPHLGKHIQDHMAERRDPPCAGMDYLIRQLFSAVEHVHSRNIVHCDLKPANMVVAESGALRLIDFGCAFAEVPGHRTQRSFKYIQDTGLEYGTLPYRAIEILLGDKNFGKPVDVWAVGCIIFEIMVCKGLFRPESRRPGEVIHECFTQLGQLGNVSCLTMLPNWKPEYGHTPKDVIDFWFRLGLVTSLDAKYGQFVIRLLQFDARKRPRMCDCVRKWAKVIASSTSPACASITG